MVTFGKGSRWMELRTALLHHNPCFSVNVVVQVADRASYSDVTRVSSLLPGSPPLWLTQKGPNYYVG